MMMKTWIIGLAIVVAATGAAKAQDTEKGQRIFTRCLPCHAIGPDAQNKIGPQLNGLDGRRSGTAANYRYSESIKNSGLVWSEASFKEYIADPRTKVPGTKMTFTGIKDSQEVSDLWDYIKQFNADGSIKR